jgi:hypothetical protein
VTEDEYYREKIQLDKQRLELDKNKSKFEASVFHRHAGAVITALVAFAAVVVSGADVIKTGLEKRAAVKIDLQQNTQELDLERLRLDKDWRTELAKFVSENKDLIFSKQPNEREQIENVILAVFPPDKTKELFEKLREIAPDEDQANQWQSAERKADNLIRPKLYLHIVDASHRDQAKALGKSLSERGVSVQGVELVKSGPDSSELRVLKQEDQERAKMVKEMLSKLGVDVKQVDLSEKYGSWKGIETGTLELWLGFDFAYEM